MNETVRSSNLKSLALGVLRFCFSAVKFLSALAADGTIPDVEGIISSNLSSGFDSLKRSVTDSMASQEKTMAAVQVLDLSFCFCFSVDGRYYLSFFFKPQA